MRRVCFAFLLTLFLAVHVHAGEKICEWRFDTKKDLKKIQFSFHGEDNKFSWSVSSADKTPDGENSMVLQMINARANAVAHEKQVNFNLETHLQKNSKYRIEFWCKGSQPGDFSLTAAQAKAPYQAAGLPQEVNKTVRAVKKWQKVAVEFFPSRNWNCELALPRLMLAHFPNKARLYIGPVRFVKLEKHLALNLNPQWQVFVDIAPGATFEPDRFGAVPKSLPGADGAEHLPHVIGLEENVVDLGKLNGAFALKKAALLFNEFTSPEDGVMQIGVSADWWLEFAVNGNTAFSTMKTGNGSNSYRPEDHVFNFPVVKGRNLITVRVLSGSGGWKFAAGSVPFVKDPNAIRTITDGDEWKAINISDDKMTVKAGTALDLSGIVTREPAGSSGRVIINRSGHLAFSEKPEQSARFLSFNASRFDGCPPKHESVTEWTDEEIDDYVEAVARQGYNMVRMHYAHGFITNSFTNFERGLGTNTKIPQTIEELPVNKQSVDRFDYLVAAFKEKGIYINLDAMAGHGGFTGCNVYWSRDKMMSFRERLLFDPVYRNNWKAGVDYMLNHINPHTGTALVDDPVLVNLEFFNEQDFLLHNDIFMKSITPLWKEHLHKKYVDIEKLKKAWMDYAPAAQIRNFDSVPPADEKMLRTGSAAAKDGADFYTGLMQQMNKWYFETVRELGYKGLVTQWDMIMRTMEVPARAQMPVIAQHSYHSHPGYVDSDNPDNRGIPNRKGKNMIVGQSSSLNSTYFRAAAATRFIDRPFIMTEYSHSYFNKYRHERGLYFGSYAALQGWDSLAAHSGMVRTVTGPITGFENANDPISRASEVVTAFTWLRGDVRESSHLVEIRLEQEKLFPENILSAVGDEYAQLAMLCKIGISCPEVKPLMPVADVRADLTAHPSTFTSLGITSWYASAASTYGNRFPQLVDALRKKNILSKANRTDPNNRLYQSDTGELTLFGRNESMMVVTPRLEGLIIKKNAAVKLGKVFVKGCSVPASVTVVSLDATRELENANRLLLVFSTDALNSGTVFVRDGIISDLGSLPVLMRTGKLALSLRNAAKSVKIYALNMDGTRNEEIPATVTGGIINININTAKLEFCTPFFEIVTE